MKAVRDEFVKLESDAYKTIKKSKKTNAKGSLINHIMSWMDNDILQILIEKLIEREEYYH